MAVTLDQANIGQRAQSGVAASTTNTTAAVAAGAMIVAITFTFTTAAATASHTMSGGGLTWVRIHTVSSGTLRISIHRAFAPSGLASGTTLTHTAASSSDHTWCMASYLGVDTTTPVDAFNGIAASTAAWSSNTLTGTDVGDAAVGGAGTDGTLRTSVLAGDNVERIDFNSATTSGSVNLYDDLNAEANDTVAGTWSGAQAHIGIGASFNPAAGGTDATVVVGAGTADAAGTSVATKASSTVAVGVGTATAAGTAAATQASSTVAVGVGTATAAGTSVAPQASSTVAVGAGSATAAGTTVATQASSAVVVGVGTADASGTAVTPDAPGSATVLVGVGTADASGTEATPVAVSVTEPPPVVGPTGPGYEEGGDETSIYGDDQRVKVGPARAWAKGTRATPRVLNVPVRVRIDRRVPVGVGRAVAAGALVGVSQSTSVESGFAVAQGTTATPRTMVPAEDANLAVKRAREDAELFAVLGMVDL